MATPRLSIIVKLPFAAPATASIASSVLIPIIEATSAALCIESAARFEDSSIEKPAPWKRAPILFAVPRKSEVERPILEKAFFAVSCIFAAYSPNTASEPPIFCSNSPDKLSALMVKAPMAVAPAAIPAATVLPTAKAPLPTAEKAFLSLLSDSSPFFVVSSRALLASEFSMAIVPNSLNKSIYTSPSSFSGLKFPRIFMEFLTVVSISSSDIACRSWEVCKASQNSSNDLSHTLCRKYSQRSSSVFCFMTAFINSQKRAVCM